MANPSDPPRPARPPALVSPVSREVAARRPTGRVRRPPALVSAVSREAAAQLPAERTRRPAALVSAVSREAAAQPPTERTRRHAAEPAAVSPDGRTRRPAAEPAAVSPAERGRRPVAEPAARPVSVLPASGQPAAGWAPGARRRRSRLPAPYSRGRSSEAAWAPQAVSVRGAPRNCHRSGSRQEPSVEEAQENFGQTEPASPVRGWYLRLLGDETMMLGSVAPD